jgi:hypothetical protein
MTIISKQRRKIMVPYYRKVSTLFQNFIKLAKNYSIEYLAQDNFMVCKLHLSKAGKKYQGPAKYLFTFS